MSKLINFRSTDKTERQLKFLRREKKGGYNLSEACRKTIDQAAKKLGWKPDA